MDYRAVDVIDVYAWGEQVGAVALDPASRFYAFEYHPTWLRRGMELSPLQLPLAPGVRVFRELSPITYQRLPALLADSLPDRFGASLLDAYLAGEGVRQRDITPLDRLAYLGSRGMGALEFRPPRSPPPGPETAYEIAHIVDESRNAVNGSFGTESDATAGVRDLIQVKSNTNGLRAKAIVTFNNETQEVRGGHLDAPDGFAHWIIKLDGVNEAHRLAETNHMGRVEYAYSLMARAAGVDMMECRLFQEQGRAHFMTRRFDRDGNERLHTQTLCALSHLDFREPGVHDYAEYLLAIRSLGLGRAAERQAFLRAAFNVMAGNRDDHTKNFGFVLPRDGTWRLAPAYDVTFSDDMQWRMMSVDGEFGDVSADQLMILADRFAVANASVLLAGVADVIESWSEFAMLAGTPSAAADVVAAGLRPLRATHRRRRRNADL